MKTSLALVSSVGPSAPAEETRHASPVRFRDGEWEYRCASCARKQLACFWPLTLEFWNPHMGMAMCRACKRTERRRSEAARRRRETAAARQARIERMRAYRVEAADALRISRSAALMAPEQLERRRARDRAYYANLTPEQRERRAAYIREWKARNPERVHLLRQRYLDSDKGKAARRAQYLRAKAKAA